jgi:hypothetical protein
MKQLRHPRSIAHPPIAPENSTNLKPTRNAWKAKKGLRAYLLLASP